MREMMTVMETVMMMATMVLVRSVVVLVVLTNGTQSVRRLVNVID